MSSRTPGLIPLVYAVGSTRTGKLGFDYRQGSLNSSHRRCVWSIPAARQVPVQSTGDKEVGSWTGPQTSVNAKVKNAWVFAFMLHCFRCRFKGNATISLCDKQSPITRRGGAWGLEGYSSCSLLISALDGVSGQRHASVALYPRGKDPRYPLDRKLGGPQSRSGHRD
jgi:hypothetical protein